MTKLAFIRSVEIQQTFPYLAGLKSIFANENISAKLFFTDGECSAEDFPGETEKLPEDISPNDLVEKLLDWRPDSVVSLSIPDEHALRDAIVGEILSDLHIPAVAHPVIAGQILSNKWETKLLVQQFGIKTPQGMLLDGDLLNKRNVSVPAYHDLILRSARSIGYPLLTKPLWDCLGNGITFLPELSDLERFLASPYNGHVVLEKCVEGRLCSIEIIGQNHEYIFQPLLWKGATGPHAAFVFSEVRHSIADDAAATELDHLKKKLVTLCNHLNVNGSLEIEMIYHEGEFQVIEINPRVSGSTTLSIAASGLNTYEALVHIAVGTWKKFCATARQSASDLFAIQFPFIETKKDRVLQSGFDVVKSNSFSVAGNYYPNAVLSFNRRKIDSLLSFIDSQYRLSEETTAKIQSLVRRTKSGSEISIAD